MERRGILTAENNITKNLINVIDFIGGEELSCVALIHDEHLFLILSS